MKCVRPKLKGWKEIPEGGTIVEPGSSIQFDVSAWRVSRPVIDQSKCTKCGLCLPACPFGAVAKTSGIKPLTPAEPVPVGGWGKKGQA